MGDLMVLYATQQVHQRLDVVLEVEQGLFDRFAHGFVGGEMNNAFNVGMFFKNGFCIVQGTKVYLVMRDLFPVMDSMPSSMRASERLWLSMEMTSYPCSRRSTMVCEPM